jgi:hypothetical protein
VRRDFDVSSTSDDAAIAAEAPRHPVFRLTPIDEQRSEDAEGLGRVGRRD